MAADPDSLDLVLAAATHLDMLEIVEVEKRLRKQLLDRVRLCQMLWFCCCQGSGYDYCLLLMSFTNEGVFDK